MCSTLRFAAALLFLLASAPAVNADLPRGHLRAQLQPVLDELAAYHNVSFSIGVKTASETVVAFAGLDNRDPAAPTNISETSRFPAGSVTKSWTATAVMRLWEQGRMDIDAPLSTYVDPILKRLNDTTMAELWNHDPRLVNVTARNTMGMRAGLNDYDDKWYADYVQNATGTDRFLTPIDLIWAVDKKFVCDPGTCGHYASPGYELLGLALAQVINPTASWEELDQLRAALPADLLASEPAYAGVVFPGKVACDTVPDVVHQYNMRVFDRSTPTHTDAAEVVFKDIIKSSCLNGFTCGNIAATVDGIAQYYWDLLHGNIVSNKTLHEMTLNQPLTNGWAPGLAYGLGLMQTKLPQHMDPGNVSWLVGHGGCDYGSIALHSGFNALYNFSMSVASNSVAGMNCSAAYRARYPVSVGAMYNQGYYTDATCALYDVVLQALSGGKAPRLVCPSIHDVGTGSAGAGSDTLSATSDYTCTIQ